MDDQAAGGSAPAGGIARSRLITCATARSRVRRCGTLPVPPHKPRDPSWRTPRGSDSRTRDRARASGLLLAICAPRRGLGACKVVANDSAGAQVRARVKLAPGLDETKEYAVVLRGLLLAQRMRAGRGPDAWRAVSLTGELYPQIEAGTVDEHCIVSNKRDAPANGSRSDPQVGVVTALV